MAATLTAPEVPAILADYNAQLTAARESQANAVRDAIATGRDALYAQGSVPFPRETAEIRAARAAYDRDYRAAVRAGYRGPNAARPGAVRAADRARAARVATLCPVCASAHAGEC